MRAALDSHYRRRVGIIKIICVPCGSFTHDDGCASDAHVSVVKLFSSLNTACICMYVMGEFHALL